MSYSKPISRYFVPTASGTIVIPNFDDTVLAAIVDPAAPIIGTVNIIFPGNAMDGQVIRVFFTNPISILNITSPDTAGLIGNLTAAVVGSSAVYAFSIVLNKWIKG